MASMNLRSRGQSNPRGARKPKPSSVSGVMPWQLSAELDRRNSSSSIRRSSTKRNIAVGNANSASQLQQRLMGGMNLSLALPRANVRPEPVRNNGATTTINSQNGSWGCSVCGAWNHWRDGDSCSQCFQRAIISSVETRTNDIVQSFNQRAPPRQRPVEPSLSAEQWANLEHKAVHRQEGGIAEPCPICLEEFKRGVAQVILSCSHIFHATCLRNFEKFQGRDPTKEKPACPVCRAVDYEQKSTELGGVAFSHSMASRIQALARGVATRTRYALLVREWINGGGGDEKRRREYVASELSRMSQQFLVDSVEDDSLDALLAASDDALALSQSVFNNDSTTSSANNISKLSSANSGGSSRMTAGKWYEVLGKARERCDQECAICMNSFQSIDDDDRRSHQKSRVILSCSHVFHEACLSGFERFTLTSSSPSNCKCPMCRQAKYEKRFLSRSAGFLFQQEAR